jgi:putative ABC transport system permease protein
VLLYCLGIAWTTGMIAGLSPAIESVRPKLSESLKGSSSAATSGRRRLRLRSVLVAVQIALSLLLLVEASLLARAQRRFFSHDPGFDTRQVLLLTLASVNTGFEPPASFYQGLESRIGALPGVLQSSFVSIAPWSGRSSTGLKEVDGKRIPSTRDYRTDPALRRVSPQFFTAIALPLVRGRVFSRVESSSNRNVTPVVISEAMARRYWPGQDAIGHHFRTSALHEVMGICRDVQSVRYMQDDGPFYYAPLDTMQAKPPYMLVRVSGDTRAAATSVRDVVRQMDPQMAATVVTLASIVEQQGERLKPVKMYGAIAGSLALLLALTGVYGVVAVSVSQRIREIGIRMALGARPGDVVWMVLRTGSAPVFAGLLAGIGLSIAASAGMQAILYGLNPRDPWTLIAVPVILLMAALVAIWIPARRAASIDPLTSLRYE